MRITAVSTRILALMMGLGVIALRADPSPAKPSVVPRATLDPRASLVLHSMSDYLKTAKSFSFNAEIMYDDVGPSGQKIAFQARTAVSLRRPNRFYVEQIADTGSRQLWFDGQQLTLLDPLRNTYAVEPAAGNTDKALDHLITILHFTPPLSDFLYEDPARVLSKNTTHGFDVGISTVDEARCQHLAFVGNAIDWQIWVENGKQRVPRKLVITYKTLPGAPQLIATLSHWDFTSRLPDSLFQADIPPGVTQLEFLKAGDFSSPAARQH
jgi:hypothetical protein